jgi:lipoprotein-releasing system permease protein
MGIPIEKIGKVNRFPDSLWLQHNKFIEEAKEPGTTPAQRQLLADQARDRSAHPSFKLALPPEAYRDALPNQKAQTDVASYPGMIPGSMVVGIHRESNGQTVGRDPLLYITPVKLTTIAIRPHSFGVDVNDKSERIYWIVDDSHTGLWQYDNSFVYVPFEQLQTDLRMTAEDVLDPDTGKKIGQEPARTSEIHVKVKDGYDLNQAKNEVEQVVKQVFAENKANVGTFYPEPRVQTWREKQAVWINAIQNEELLTVFLFAIISLVAIFLIFCIFYMIVVEKTKDIGIIKSVGATSSGVAGIFLGYGLAIGIVGALLGLLVSFLIVHNINELHTALGKLFGIQIWNPEVYLFDKIPNTMRWRDVLVIVPIAIISSVLGALLPAIRAARLHPVESLRWE